MAMEMRTVDLREALVLAQHVGLEPNGPLRAQAGH